METLKTINAGDTLTTRSVCDSNCIFSVEVLERKGQFVKVLVKGDKEPKRVKVSVWDGRERIYAMGKYSMAPVFSAL